MNYKALIERVNAEEEIKKRKYLESKILNQKEKAKESIYDIYGHKRINDNPEIIGSNDYTYQKIKNKIIYASTEDSYLKSGKELILNRSRLD